MEAAGIVAEYNPFHNGHRYLQQQAKNLASCTAAVLSGYFVQRGGPALFSPFLRAKAALQDGLDLAVALPVSASLAPAELFARAGVLSLARLGVSRLVFGCESGDAASFLQAAQTVAAAESSSLFSRLLKEGMGYPKARSEAVRMLYGKEAEAFLATPNNQLGVCYAAAVRDYAPNITLCPVPRQGTGHHSLAPQGEYASATLLRQEIAEGRFPAGYLPPAARALFAKAPRCPEWGLEQAVLAALRTMSPQALGAIAQVGEGLEHRILRAAKEAVTLKQLLSLCACGRYTNARLRRIFYCALLGISRQEQTGRPEYLRLLGMTHRGRELLSAMPKHGIPVTASPARFSNLAQVQRDALAADLWGLGCSPRLPGGEWFRHPLVQKNGGDSQEWPSSSRENYL